MSLKIGKSYFLDNKEYKILKQLPSGSYKSTYIAIDKHNDSNVVIAESIYPNQPLSEGKKFKRIMKYLTNEKGEIECNPRIICPISIIENGKYIITNYFEGLELFDFIGEHITMKKFIPLELVHKIMMNCVAALDDLHNELHFAHLDIKPENIMLNKKTYNIGLIDLGEGCALDDISRDCDFGAAKGTEGYMSPEIMFYVDQVQFSRNLMRSSDIFSLGCVFYELLYLRRPFDWIHDQNMAVKEGVEMYLKKGKTYEFMYDINKNRNEKLIGKKSSQKDQSNNENLQKLDEIVSKMMEPNAKLRIKLTDLKTELSNLKLDIRRRNLLSIDTTSTRTFTESDGRRTSTFTEGDDRRQGTFTEGSTPSTPIGKAFKKSKAIEDLSELQIEEEESEERVRQIGGQLTKEIFKLISEKENGLERLESLLTADPLEMYSFNKNDDNKFTTIEWAVENNCKECIEIIISTYELFKDDILRFNTDIRLLGQPLHLAVKNKNKDLLHYLITNDFSINRVNKMGYTPLHVAVLQNNLEMVKLLIRYSARIDSISRDEATPLKLAIENKYFDIAKALIIAGANIKEDLTIDPNDYTDKDIISFLESINVKGMFKEKRQKEKMHMSKDKKYRLALYKRMCKNLEDAIVPHLIRKVSRELRTDITNLSKEEICERMLKNVLFKEIIEDI